MHASAPPRSAELWHVGLVIAPETQARAACVLDEEERERLGRLRQASQRQAFVASHAALRGILGRALGCAPEALRFERGPAGKPSLAGHGPDGLRFNLSHAGQRAVVALAWGVELGVDLESPEHGAQALAELDLVFSPAERAAIAACSPSDQALARLRCWVRKEALLKAAGCGFTDDVRRFTVSTTAQARLLDSRHPDIAADAWSLAGFEFADGWVGALAAAGPMPRVAVQHWSWST